MSDWRFPSGKLADKQKSLSKSMKKVIEENMAKQTELKLNRALLSLIK